MKIGNAEWLTGVVSSGSVSSDPFNIEHVYMFSIQTVYSGGGNGSLKFQVSNDVSDQNFRGVASGVTNWTDLATPSPITLSGAGTGFLNSVECGARWARAVYTRNAGSLTISGMILTKGV